MADDTRIADQELLTSIQALTEAITQNTQAEQESSGPGGGTRTGGSPTPSSTFAKKAMGASQGILASFGIDMNKSGGYRVSGAAAQSLVSANMGGSRAAFGRAGLAGLAIQAASGASQDLSRGASNVRGGQVAGVAALESSFSQQNLFNTATLGLYNAFSNSAAENAAAARVDKQALSITQQFAASARALGVPAGPEEMESVAKASIAFATQAQLDASKAQLEISKNGLTSQLINERNKGGSVTGALVSPFLLGTTQNDSFRNQFFQATIKEQTKILQRIADGLERTNAGRATEGNK